MVLEGRHLKGVLLDQKESVGRAAPLQKLLGRIYLPCLFQLSWVHAPYLTLKINFVASYLSLLLPSPHPLSLSL